MERIQYKTARVDGLDIFYREAGRRGNPVVILLHGFPSSSFMFRGLIPLLARDYHVIAPDYPGFGHSSFPNHGEFSYTFGQLAEILGGLLDAISIDRFTMYIQDYGAPIGLRLALMRPESVVGLVVQNGNAYEEGLSDEWLPLKRFWSDPTEEAREALRGWLTEAGIRSQYTAGLGQQMVSDLSPDTWTLDWALLNRPGNIDVQLDLFHDYRMNVELYPEFQRYFREHRPHALIVWGRRDPFFTTAGARAFRRDLPDAEIHLLDGGHFLLESHLNEAGSLILDHLHRTARSAIKSAGVP